MRTALIAGGTGLVGSQLLQLLLASDRYGKVVALTRSALPVHPKLEQVPVTQETLSGGQHMKVDDVFCCLGTTIAKAKTKENFYQVDFYYPLLLARSGYAHGARQYMLISALGASKDSTVYYNRVKGEVEEAIGAVGIETLHIFRPSLLLGPRQEQRTGEDAAKFIYKIFGFLIPRKYKAIDSAKVARAMLQYASQEQKGTFIHESKDLQQF
ncbi:NAD-dependent epimerase/dehydratase family protein [Dawidia soli]|uniref:NAD-dependent epimerase/dehydratase family protein n=1 Tax=Dawidia soli TaxID=2782352 RepID=A0AAP2DB71_9BACT|nr:NAD-dependent epimerase/dehydratase family protein [Dawidia soli]MBT1687685.1 NAD-dependent epimerase/dehydratase family protein [Dawidia soli]